MLGNEGFQGLSRSLIGAAWSPSQPQQESSPKETSYPVNYASKLLASVPGTSQVDSCGFMRLSRFYGSYSGLWVFCAYMCHESVDLMAQCKTDLE